MDNGLLPRRRYQQEGTWGKSLESLPKEVFSSYRAFATGQV